MDFSLSNEQRSWQMTARKFANEEIKPITLDLDEAPDAHGTFDWDIVEKGSRLGFRTLAVPKEYGGEGTDYVTQALVMAELARGDSAISKTFSQNWKWSPFGAIGRDHGAGRACLGCLGQEVVPVEPVAAQGDEADAGRELPGVGGDAVHVRWRSSDPPAAGGGCQLLGCKAGSCHESPGAPGMPSARRASSRSSKWRFSAPTIW